MLYFKISTPVNSLISLPGRDFTGGSRGSMDAVYFIV